MRHTSCSLLIQENADPDVRRDLDAFFRRLVPPADDPSMALSHPSRRGAGRHAGPYQGGADGGLAVDSGDGGRLALGTWQGIYLFEHRDRAAPARGRAASGGVRLGVRLAHAKSRRAVRTATLHAHEAPMSFLKSLFGGARARRRAAGRSKSIEHNGFTIHATPYQEGGQYQLCGVVEKEIDGVVKSIASCGPIAFPASRMRPMSRSRRASSWSTSRATRVRARHFRF